jgi:acetylornithine deacetylase
LTPGEADPAALLEALTGIPSVTGEESALVGFVEAWLRDRGWACGSIPVSHERRNLFARRGGAPRVVFSTHADTVPPFFPPHRSGGELLGRGACDAKGSLAAMLVALDRLAGSDRVGDAALLLLVGEERGSDGAIAANSWPDAPRSQYLVGGEPTENRFVSGTKGCLRVALETRGTAAHSSISDRGRSGSAVEPLLDVLAEIRRQDFPDDPTFGSTTVNIGVIAAGTAPNVVAEKGRAEVLWRTGVPIARVLEAVSALARGKAELSVAYRSEPVRFRVPRALAKDSPIVSFACDLPLLPRWGQPILVGPGSILDAHASHERVRLSDVAEAAAIYRDLALGLLRDGEDHLEPAAGS